MATTDAALVGTLLDALEATHVPYAILHREADAANGVIDSDVDVAVGRPATEVALNIASAVRHAGVGLALIWPYDSNSLTTFWLTRDCKAGAQLDLLNDPDGEGRYGIRTDAALRRAERGARWLRLPPEIEALYLLSKRWVKGDIGRIGGLLGNVGNESAISLADELLAPHGRRRVQAAVTGRRPTHALSTRTFGGMLSRRGWCRLRYPVGVMIRVSSQECDVLPILNHVCSLLDGILVKAEITDGLLVCERVRRWFYLRRPYLLLSDGHVGSRPDIDLLIDASASIDDVVDQIWCRLAENAQRTLEKWADVYTS